MLARLLALCPVALLAACPPNKQYPPPPPPERCEVDLASLGFFSAVGSGAKASRIEAGTPLVGGDLAHGQPGDFLLENAQVRVVIQGARRVLGPNPYGGAVIDADVRRPAGEPGRDQLGKVALLYQFGRTPNVTKVEVLRDGAQGGYAVVAASGNDALNDYLNLPGVIDTELPGAKLAVDPNAPLPLLVTTYYVLSPGESRVRMLTAFCNTGHDNVSLAVGDLIEQGSTELFNPAGCTNGLGLADDCWIDPYPWFGLQGDGVAYALRSYRPGSDDPEASSAMLAFAGVVGTVSGAKDQAGLLSWLDTAATQRPGAFGVVAGERRGYLRDLLIGRALADITSQLLVIDNAGKGRLTLTVKHPDGAPAEGARVAVILASDGRQKTLLVTGADGTAKADLPVGNYTLKVGKKGHAVAAPVDVNLPVTGLERELQLGPARRLRVTVTDPSGARLPAKVTVLCPGGACAAPSSAYRPFHDVDPLPSNVQALGFADGTGVADVLVPPGAYEVLVSRGPEYSGWPDTFPAMGQAVDLTAMDQSVDATLAHVVDSAGWLSADLHVHAVNSADSAVPNRERVRSFAAEGVDVLVATDHDVVTDLSPHLAELELGGKLETMVGCELSPFDYGHHQAFPLAVQPSPNGGALDWAGGDGPALRLDQLYAEVRQRAPGAVLQLNHARGSLGSLTRLEVDTSTGASHADPKRFRMEPHPSATANDTRLFSDAFDAMEVMNGATASLALMNDWMTFLSRGRVKTPTAVSDSHHVNRHTAGYGRTWARLGTYSPAGFAEALAAHRAVGGNGPFVRLTARKLDSGGNPVGGAVEVGETLRVDPNASEAVELTVDVQAPEWMTFDVIEVYTHASGREALGGQANTEWPASRVHQSRSLNPGALPVEAVPMIADARRVHAVERFTVTPAADTWYAVFVRGSAASRPLFPLVIDGVSCSSSGACTTSPTYPFAFTGAVLIDADGSGSYDDFPLKGQALSAPRPRPPPPPYRVPTAAEVRAAIERLKHHGR